MNIGAKLTFSFLAFLAVLALWGIVMSSRFSLSAGDNNVVYQQDNWTGRITLYHLGSGDGERVELRALARTRN